MFEEQVNCYYVAGLFDGEGCVRIAKNKTRRNACYQLYVSINMSDPRAIKKVLETFGGKLYTSRKASKPTHRILFSWVACSQKAADFLRQIRPFVTVKADEIDVALEFQSHIDSMGRQWRRNKILCSDIIAYRESLFQKISSLKHVQHLP